MSWVEKYNINSVDIQNKKWYTKIYQKDASIISSTLTGLSSPIIFEYTNDSDDLFSPLKEVKANLNVITDTNFYLLDLYSYEPKTYLVQIYQDEVSAGTLYYRGFIDTQNYSASYNPAPTQVSIACNTGLSLLKDIEYKDAGGNYYNGRKYESEIILDILGKVDCSSFKEYVNVYESRMNKTSSYSPLDQTQIDVDVFRDMYCDEVLSHILSKYNACIVQKDGIFNIYRPTDLVTNNINGRFFTDVSTKTSISFNPAQYIKRPTQNSTIQQLPGGIMNITAPAKKININQDYGNKESWLDNHKLLLSTYKNGVWDYWTSSSSEASKPISNWIPSELDGAVLPRQGSPLNDTVYLKQTFAVNSVKSANDVFVLEFDYLLYNYSGSTITNCGFFVKLKYDGGNYWLTPDTGDYCKWVTSDSYCGTGSISVEDRSVDGAAEWVTYRKKIIGLPASGSYTFTFTRIYSPTVTSIVGAIKNVKFYCTSDKVVRELKLKTVKKRFLFGFINLFKKEFWKKVYTSEDVYNDNEEIVEKLYNPDVSANYGQELNYDYILGDVVDTSLNNVLEQFSGSLNIIKDSSKLYTSSWSSTYDSSKLLLEIAGDEIARQYNTPKQFIQLPFMEVGTSKTSFNVIGNVIDSDNNDKVFAFNRGSFDIKNREWNIDLVELSTPPDTLRLSSNSINFNKSGGDASVSVTVTPFFREWTAKETNSSGSLLNYPWFSTNINGNILTIDCSQQLSGSAARTGYVTIDSSYKTALLTITQDASIAILKSMTVSGEDLTQYGDGGNALCIGGQWDVSSNAAWYITYPSILNGIISPTSGTGNAIITAYHASGMGSGTIDFYWTSNNAYAGYSFDVVSQAGGCV